MILKIAIYILFYVSVFLLGFFGITPILLLDSIEDKIPYIILVIIGYPSLIGLMVLVYKKEIIKPGIKKKQLKGDGVDESKDGGEEEFYDSCTEEGVEEKAEEIEDVQEEENTNQDFNKVDDVVQESKVKDEVKNDKVEKERVNVIDEEDIEALKEVEREIEVVDKDVNESFNKDIDVKEKSKVLEGENT
jgi:hypothetical protein